MAKPTPAFVGLWDSLRWVVICHPFASNFMKKPYNVMVYGPGVLSSSNNTWTYISFFAYILEKLICRILVMKHEDATEQVKLFSVIYRKAAIHTSVPYFKNEMCNISRLWLFQPLLWSVRDVKVYKIKSHVTWEESVNYYIISVAQNIIMETYLF